MIASDRNQKKYPYPYCSWEKSWNMKVLTTLWIYFLQTGTSIWFTGPVILVPSYGTLCRRAPRSHASLPSSRSSPSSKHPHLSVRGLKFYIFYFYERSLSSVYTFRPAGKPCPNLQREHISQSSQPSVKDRCRAFQGQFQASRGEICVAGLYQRSGVWRGGGFRVVGTNFDWHEGINWRPGE